MQSAIHVLIVDDQKLVRVSMQQVLKKQSIVSSITEAASGKEAIELAKNNRFDIALVDLKMPEMDGLETSRELLKIHPNLKILVVTACIDELILPQLFKEGVCGYFSKSGNSAEITSAIKTIQAGQRYISPSINSQLNKNGDSPDTELAIFDTLSERELQVVLMLINGGNIQKAAKRLRVNDKTISSYRARSFQKLAVSNDVELTLLAARRGLLTNREETPTQ
jgi:two-component system invasion response regulator UvrY